MDGHALPVRVSRTPSVASVAAPTHPVLLPRQHRVPAAAPMAPERNRVAPARPLDPHRYETPFPDDAGLPCCTPPPPPPRATAKELCAQAVAGVDDYEDRDPNRINQRLQLLWEDVVAEPDGVRSPELLWRGSARLFRLTRDLVYASLSCFLGPPVAVVLGAGFAVIAFAYIWCVSPTLRACRVTLGALNTLIRAVAHATLVPVTEALGYLCSNIRIRVHNGDVLRRSESTGSLLA